MGYCLYTRRIDIDLLQELGSVEGGGASGTTSVSWSQLQ